MQFARVSALFDRAIHLGHKPKTNDLSAAISTPASTAVDAHERKKLPTLRAPEAPATTPAVPPPAAAADDAAQRLKTARTLVAHMTPAALDQDAMALIYAVGLLDEPGCSVQELSAEMLSALTSSGHLEEIAKVRASTMQLSTLQERAALIGTPVGQAEEHFSRAFVNGFIDYTSQHAAFGGRAAGVSGKALPAVSPKTVARVREIYRTMHPNPSQMRPDMLSFALGHVASTMDSGEVKRLAEYLKSEPGKRGAAEWAAGDEQVQNVMRSPDVQSSMMKAFRLAVPASARSSDSEADADSDSASATA